MFRFLSVTALILASMEAVPAQSAVGRLTVGIQTDGDLCYSPGILWTAAHHRIRLLSIMHNNCVHSEGPISDPKGLGPAIARRRRGQARRTGLLDVSRGA